jgi:hypothetical protein
VSAVRRTPLPFKFNRAVFEAAFRDFLAHATILSKNSGYTAFELFDLPWAAGEGVQEYGLCQILDGLENDVHWFVVLKARQLGWTTLSLLFDLFWCGMYPGLQGAIVTDTEPNKEKLRLLIGGDKSMRGGPSAPGILDLLPPTHPIPVVKHNRNGLVFENGSMIDYLVAGTKKGRGGLGRSRAYNFLHATEMAQYGDDEGVESLISSLSDSYPARFYNIESTAHGYNVFHDQWADAVADEITKKAVFLPWWRHPEYICAKGSRLYERYGHGELAEDEREAAAIVKRDYSYTITREQWAWYRHRKDPQRRANMGEMDVGKAEIVEVEYPSYPDQAFRLSGSPFFPGKTLDQAVKRAERQKFKGYYYHFGETFTELRRLQAHNARMSQLKVWEEPHPNGVYIVAADPSYGRGKNSDRHCIQVFRCYADKLVQVAEFCLAQIPPFQLTWILLDLCGWYGYARWIVEIDGPGEAVMTEFRHLRTLLDTGKLAGPWEEEEAQPSDGEAPRRRPRSPLRNVRDYLYHRPDALTPTFNQQWKTTNINKPVIMTQLQDHFLMEHVVINSVMCLYEMRHLVRVDSQIEAEGTYKDDRPMAAAMGVRCWLDFERRELEAQGRSFDREQAQDAAIGEDDTPGFMNYIMAMRGQQRTAERRALARTQRRGPRWEW